MSPDGNAHLDGSDLLGFIDREGGPQPIGAWTAHLAACPSCAGRLQQLEDDARLVSTWLERYDEAVADLRSMVVPIRPFRRPRLASWLRVAAAVLLAAAPLMAIPATRTWITERLTRATSRAATAPATPTPTMRTIRFAPAAGAYAVEFDVPEPGGTLIVSWASGTDALLNAPTSAEPVVSSGRLALRNSGAQGGRYELSLPSSSDAVRVLVGGRQVRRIARTDHPVVVPLDPPG